MIHDILKEYWGYDNFRPLQEEIIQSILDVKDTLALLPTGGGKSICFQVPALANEGLCLVVSPLIALMKDQVENLNKKGIRALAVYSGMSFLELKKILQNASYGNYKFLYVSPERLETNLFLEYLPAMNINLIAIDEAHCISQWGYDFRPPYLRVAKLREYLPDVPVLALTASATKEVQDDVCEKLVFKKDSQRFQKSFERPNLSYSVFNVATKQTKLVEILKNVKGSAIVYCKSRKHTKDVAELLSMNGMNASYYHAGLNSDERNKKQESWIENETRIIACTNAFGMGIDKPDVRAVIHYDVPDCLENYYQEAGRAGRDEKRAYAVLLYSDKEINDLKQQSDIRFPTQEEIKKTYTALMNQLQVPAGIGQGMNYDFDMGSFASNFKLNILTATYAVKALEQEDILSFNEVFFKPSTAVFTVEREQLVEFEKMYPDLDDTVKGLLRSYEGIFDFPATIYETQLAKFLKKSIVTVKDDLNRSKQYGIIDYSPQKDSPQVLLLKNRMYADSFQINLENYKKRKQNFEARINTIIEYVKNTTICRSQIIADYFNSPVVKECGICDNCINKKSIEISSEEFQQISLAVLQQIKMNSCAASEILKEMNGVKKEKFWKVIQYLQAEKKLLVNSEGLIENVNK